MADLLRSTKQKPVSEDSEDSEENVCLAPWKDRGVFIYLKSFIILSVKTVFIIMIKY